MSVEEYYHTIMQSLYSEYESEGGFHETIFTDMICQKLVESAVLEDFTLTEYKKVKPSMKIDAYDYQEDTGKLNVMVSYFRINADLTSLSKTSINLQINRIKRFLLSCFKENLLKVLDESHPVYELAYDIYNKKIDPRKIRIILISNSIINNLDFKIEDSDIVGIPCEFDIWDLGRFYRTEISGQEKEKIIINFTEFVKDGIRCLPAYTGSDTIQSFLLVLPGQILASVYDHYGERLLEQNVRTFLQFRGKVNKGMKGTLSKAPDMFFAYNNGITATAESVEMDKSCSNIRKIKDFQIVNGGQTTASIFMSYLKDKISLSKVFVQVKLSVVPDEMKEGVVPKISEFANTQNKVNAADFFSNHPFHIRIEDFSRRLWADCGDGTLRMTHWFYERARGQYLNMQSKMTPPKARAFQKESPRNQLITKTDLAKYMNSWDMKPNIVSRGAQKNFSFFADDISKKWKQDSDNTWVNEKYFKELIAKAILFKSLDKQIMRQDWYGGYKAQIVTYSIAMFSKLISDMDRNMDFNWLWDTQMISPVVENQLLKIAEQVNEGIHNTPIPNMNISEWCKKAECWLYIQKLKPDVLPQLNDELISRNIEYNMERDAKKLEKLDTGIEYQRKVVERGSKFWKMVLDWNIENNELSSIELDILNKFGIHVDGGKVPSDRQSAKLINMEKRIRKHGFME